VGHSAWSTCYQQKHNLCSSTAECYQPSSETSANLIKINYVILQHTTSHKAVDSIPYTVTGFFNGPDPSSRAKTLGPTQPLTGMSSRNLPGGEGWPTACKADNLTVICELIAWRMWESQCLTTQAYSIF
jgi:hypothetical protein